MRYSWLMAVRPIAGSDMFDVDVVSYFQRPSRSSDPTDLSKPYHEMLFQVWSYQRPNGSNGPNGQICQLYVSEQTVTTGDIRQLRNPRGTPGSLQESSIIPPGVL
ncbi:MAG: hypothetical protein ACKOJF_16885, partial [Planctomycetaceae bacterium]